MLSCKFCKIFKKIFFYRAPPVAASGYWRLLVTLSLKKIELHSREIFNTIQEKLYSRNTPSWNTYFCRMCFNGCVLKNWKPRFIFWKERRRENNYYDVSKKQTGGLFITDLVGMERISYCCKIKRNQITRQFPKFISKYWLWRAVLE